MKELEVVHRFINLCAEADLVDLKLTASRLQFLLRDEKAGSMVYASCRNLEQVDEALRGRRTQLQAPGKQTRGIQGPLTVWARPAPPEEPGDSMFNGAGGRD